MATSHHHALVAFAATVPTPVHAIPLAGVACVLNAHLGQLVLVQHLLPVLNELRQLLASHPEIAHTPQFLSNLRALAS